MHITLPAGAPTWTVGLSILGPMLIALVYGLVRLARATLPDTPAERLAWWRYYWQYRRDLRRDRWKQREQRWARRNTSFESPGPGGHSVESARDKPATRAAHSADDPGSGHRR
jgi:hypothetical protein